MNSDLLDDGKGRDEHSTDGRLAFDIRAAVIGEVPMEAQPYEFAGLTEPRVVGAGLDVAGLSMEVLESLHDAAERIHDIGNAMLCQLRFEAKREGIAVSHNAAGQFLDWITEVSSLLIDRARHEARKRRPNDEMERELRFDARPGERSTTGDQRVKSRLTMRAALLLGLPCAARNIGRARRFCRDLLDRAGHEAGRGNVVTATVLVVLYAAGL